MLRQQKRNKHKLQLNSAILHLIIKKFLLHNIHTPI
jgi:hypothetical protein